MKIALSATGPNLDADVDPRFGRAAYFIIVDTDTGEFEAIDNSANVMAGGGAGVQSSQVVAGKKAEYVLTGNVGPNAFQGLNAAGIKIITGVSGTISVAVNHFKAGKFSTIDAPTAPNRAGMR